MRILGRCGLANLLEAAGQGAFWAERLESVQRRLENSQRVVDDGLALQDSMLADVDAADTSFSGQPHHNTSHINLSESVTLEAKQAAIQVWADDIVAHAGHFELAAAGRSFTSNPCMVFRGTPTLAVRGKCGAGAVAHSRQEEAPGWRSTPLCGRQGPRLHRPRPQPHAGEGREPPPPGAEGRFGGRSGRGGWTRVRVTAPSREEMRWAYSVHQLRHGQDETLHIRRLEFCMRDVAILQRHLRWGLPTRLLVVTCHCCQTPSWNLPSSTMQ